MTTDLWMLAWSAVLTLAIPALPVVGILTAPGGVTWGFGNRDTTIELPAWVSRGRRAHTNAVENLAPFAALVLAAHVSGSANATTALGATIFFASRVAHAGLYMAGVPYLRTAAYAGGILGMAMILVQLF